MKITMNRKRTSDRTIEEDATGEGTSRGPRRRKLLDPDSSDLLPYNDDFKEQNEENETVIAEAVSSSEESDSIVNQEQVQHQSEENETLIVEAVSSSDEPSIVNQQQVQHQPHWNSEWTEDNDPEDEVVIPDSDPDSGHKDDGQSEEKQEQNQQMDEPDDSLRRRYMGSPDMFAPSPVPSDSPDEISPSQSPTRDSCVLCRWEALEMCSPSPSQEMGQSTPIEPIHVLLGRLDSAYCYAPNNELEEVMGGSTPPSSVPTMEENPVPTMEENPVPTMEENPVPTMEENPVPTMEENPVPTMEENPVPTMETEEKINPSDSELEENVQPNDEEVVGGSTPPSNVLMDVHDNMDPIRYNEE